VSLPFLLEIGTEEIPDWMIVPALESLRTMFVEAIGGEFSARLDATPRRLVLRAAGLPEKQPDEVKKVSGPAVTAPEAAVAGFARKQGVAPDQLEREDGRYVFSKLIPGRPTREILAGALPAIISKIYFPKTMYWTGKNGPRFIRPIRWIVALLGNEVVPFEIGGVPSGQVTSGHRILGAASLAVSTDNYEQKLRENFVIVSASERRKKIADEIRAFHIKPDPALLETLVYLTEFPTVIQGSFDPEFLKLPEEVLTTVMRHHQRYFSVGGEGGKLEPRFSAVMNTNADPDGLIRHGNERVLRARFNDAKFFWETDQRKKLADRVADLKHVTFQAKLGSYFEKTQRLVALVRELGGGDFALHAAILLKADLTTELVKEFTELQGVVGGLYAREQGEPEEVWQAIYDHYKPASMEDSIPRNSAGQLVSVADKLDTLRGCFKIGLIPTGSRDPFALRRAAQGIVKILVDAKLRLTIRKLLNGDAKLEEFFLDRVRYYFKDIRGLKYDEVNAVLASGWDDLVDVEERLAAIQAVRPTEDFEPLAASFKRIQNILKQMQFAGTGGAIDPALLEPGPESDLYAEFQNVRGRAANQPYRPALEMIASLRPKVDLFFDKVLVNASDAKIRQNRLTLLHTLLAEFSTIADFSEIVTNT
jgi:glycyl-tRNA synthetase beta chain